MNKRLAVGKYKNRLEKDIEIIDIKYLQWYKLKVNKWTH